MKPRCSKVIVVEGKYDKIRVESCLDATVITTEGFGIFKNEEKRELLRRLAALHGLVILSDSDGAGSLIRSHLRTFCGKEGVTDLYIPPIPGKERRKSSPSKEGLLGVEGMSNETLLSLFEEAGLLGEEKEKIPLYTKTDLFLLGYSGSADAKARRSALLKEKGLPTTLSGNAFLDVVNLLEIKL
jgi:ribonuclease M5